MKSFSRVFIVSFICFFIAIFIGSYSYLEEKNLRLGTDIDSGFYEKIDLQKTIIKKLETKPKEPEIYSNLKEAIEKSDRINFVIAGMEDVRTDTIIFASFCPSTKKSKFIKYT